MFGGLNRLLTAALVAGSLTVAVGLVAPSVARACNGGPSAENVYKECLQSGGGETPTGGSTTGSGSTPAISSQAARALAHAGKDRRNLAALVHAYGPSHALQASGDTGSPSALGSAFDLGSGPTLLLIVLAGTAVLLLGGTGMRFWRGRHHS